MTVRQITSDFVDRVGADGFHDIKRSKSIFGKCFWIILFLLAWTMVCYQVVTYIMKYFTYPVDTNVELKFDSAALFPAVTFCNLNPVKASKILEFLDEDLASVMKPQPPPKDKANLAKGSWNDEYSNFGPPAQQNTAEYENYYIDSGGGEREFWTPDHQPEEIQQEGHFYYEYFKMDPVVKKEAGHQIQDMLLECIWKEKQCFPENFTHSLHPIYGNCYTFNAGWEGEGEGRKLANPQKISMPGPSDGLSVIFYVEADEYLPLLADSTGMRVHVHPQTAVPHPEDTGYTVSSGFYSSLEMRKVEITRLPLPYNNEDCDTAVYKYGSLVKGFWLSSDYAMTTCMKLCYQEKLREKCGCVDAETFYLPDAAMDQPCNSTSPKQGFCMKQFDVEFRRGNYSTYCQGQCRQACNEIDFEVQASSAQWPNDVYMEILKDTITARSEDMKSMIQDQGAGNDDLRKNLLKIDVYYQSLNYKIVEEQAGYVLVDMLADLGGAVDLWVGMSVLAMVQVLEYLVEIAFYLGYRKHQQNSVNKIKASDVYDGIPTNRY